MTPARRPRGVARRGPVAALGAAAAGLLALSGCGAQAEPGYQGEPLVTLRGRVADSPVVQAQPLEAAIFWQRGAPPGTTDQVLAARAPVEGGAAATFTLRLYQPPPAEALQALAPGEPALARATAAAVPFGITAPAAGQLGNADAPGAPVSPAYGIDPEHWLVYLAAEARPGSLTAWWLGAAAGLPAGFHLVRVTPLDPACLGTAALADCAGAVGAAGAPDAAAAQALCLAPYRLALPAAEEPIVLRLGAVALPPAPTGCPP